jgi:transcriptional regulator with XRE-family HTH domain
MVERHAALVALGQEIRRVRREKGFSQENFAYTAGLDRAYYGAIERGERNVSALNLMRIAAALGVEVGELFPKSEVFRDLLHSPGTPTAGEE